MDDTQAPPDIDQLRALVREDAAAVDRLIRARLYSDVVLINQLGHYIIAGGGKRLRPLLALLCARAAGYSGTKHIEAAVIIELGQVNLGVLDLLCAPDGVERLLRAEHRVQSACAHGGA